MRAIQQTLERVDTIEVVSLPMKAGIVVYSILSLFGLLALKEVTGQVQFIFLVSWFIGIPLATLCGIMLFVANTAWFVASKQDQKKKDPESLLKSANRKIQLAWIAGGIATVAALFANSNVFGASRDFSATNIADACITGALTYGLFKKNLLCASFLFIYFTLIKVPLWPHLQPKAFFVAGLIMSVLMWEGIVGIIRESKARNLLKMETQARKAAIAQEIASPSPECAATGKSLTGART